MGFSPRPASGGTSLSWAALNAALARIHRRSSAPFGLVSLLPVQIPVAIVCFCECFKFQVLSFKYFGCGGGICTHDLQVMGLASCYCSTPRYILSIYESVYYFNGLLFFIMPRERIELSCLDKTHDFESCASTNSATAAKLRIG